jgi:phage tail-like protein
MMRIDDGALRGQLPMVMAADPLIPSFLMAFEDILDTLEGHVDMQPHVLDPTVAPLEMVRWVATWAGFEVSPSLPPERQRLLVQAAGNVVRWRGTREGLTMLMEAFTGGEVEVTDGGGVFAQGEAPERTTRVTVHLSQAGTLDDTQLVGLVRDQLPADAIIELTIGDRRVEESRPEGEEQE